MGFGVWSVGFGVWGLGLRVYLCYPKPCPLAASRLLNPKHSTINNKHYRGVYGNPIDPTVGKTVATYGGPTDKVTERCYQVAV